MENKIEGRALAELAISLFEVSELYAATLSEGERARLLEMSAHDLNNEHLDEGCDDPIIVRLMEKGLAEICPECGGIRPAKVAASIVSAIITNIVSERNKNAHNN